MGQGLFVSNLIEVIEAIDGIAYVDLFSPSDNILPATTTGTEATGVAFNELITEGKRQTSYYYEK